MIKDFIALVLAAVGAYAIFLFITALFIWEVKMSSTMVYSLLGQIEKAQVQNREDMAEHIRRYRDNLMDYVEKETTDDTYHMVVKDILDVNNILTDLIIKLKTSWF